MTHEDYEIVMKAIAVETELETPIPEGLVEMLREGGPDVWSECFRACVRLLSVISHDVLNLNSLAISEVQHD